MLPALVVLAILGGLSITPPYLGSAVGIELDGISPTLEIVDHVVPGLLVVAVAGLSLLLLRSGKVGQDSLFLAIALALCLLAGVWETTSHIPLVLDGGRPGSPWDAVVLHSLLGPLIAGLSLWLLLRVLATEPQRTAR